MKPTKIIEQYKSAPPRWLKDETGGGKRIFTLPNLFTFSRFVILPFFVYFVLNRKFQVAFWLILIAGAADILDGLLARALGQQSAIGAYMDPVADKATLVIAYATLWYAGQIPLWLFAIIAARDVGLMLGILGLQLVGYPPAIFPSWAGKINTNIQFYTLFFVLLQHVLMFSINRIIVAAAFYITAASTILSVFIYVWRGYVVMKLFPKDANP